jgi:hypothetical protein
MRRRVRYILLIAAGAAALSCGPSVVVLPIETSFAFTNFSKTQYAALRIREHSTSSDPASWYATPLLAPGATYRVRFLDSLGISCPDSLDLQLLVYRRINAGTPIGEDPGEAVESSPVVAGQVFALPACSVQPLETYTIVNWDAPEGTARVKIAQDTPVDQAIRTSGVFPNVDAAWEIAGVDPALADQAPPAHLDSNESVAGRVTLASGRGVGGIGVLVRTRFRVRLDDADAGNDPDSGYSDPIAVAVTDAGGAFAIDRPPGAYRVEFFADGYLFRPVSVDVESPLEIIRVIVEPVR